ncbi:ROK family protein [Psychrobacillus sp. FSL H8-0484]|uniref:ROK family protein n=1 Tax=Psychrobacillus sp. FSL H8-0484 TaxID=2921390 RepID=UPI0030F5882C
MEYIVAVDIGGTKIAAGVLNKENVWMSEVKIKSDTSSANNMYASLLESIQEAIDQANLSKEQITGIGLTIPGQLDTEKGLAIYQNNLPWENFPVGDRLAKEFPTYQLAFEHDVVAAALGEWSVRNLTDELFVYITVSTGICASIIHQGKPLRGLGLAGEIGFFPVHEGQVLENYASGSAMERALKLGDPNCTLADSFKRWKQGDKDLDSFFQDRAYQLAVAIFNVTAVLDPDRIVLGGGVINNQESFFKLIKDHYQSLCKHPLQKNWPTRIELSTLKGKSGLFGVAMKASVSI